MGALRFLLNGRLHEDSCVPTTRTVLDYLRGDLGLTGTKEGCAEGDCGACTIVIGRRTDGALRYQAVNSCLMVVPQLQGTSVLTIEGLAGPDGALHPVQRALVETHGTQCGFCTPGFAMSMYAFREGGEAPNDSAIHEMLAGNLCRCTGYRPIVEACRGLARAAEAHQPPAAPLPRIGLAGEYAAGGGRFLAPQSISELTAVLGANPDAQVIAGGTDLGLIFSKDRRTFPVLVSTAGVSELKRISLDDDALEIGGAVTYSEALPHVDRLFPSFGDLLRRLGSRQIRNLGTFAGNLATASPIGDTIPPLMVLEATVNLRSAGGKRAMALDDFIVGYRKTSLAHGEFIESIRLPRLDRVHKFATYKISKRFDQDISSVIGAFLIRISDGLVVNIRAAYGGMAERAKRAVALEAALIGKPWQESALSDTRSLLAQDFAPLDDQRASTGYRLAAAANLLRRLHTETTTKASIFRLEHL